MEAASAVSSARSYQLRFRPLRASGHSFCFPCRADGGVDLDHLTVKALNDYLFARAVVGGEYARPSVQCVDGSDVRQGG